MPKGPQGQKRPADVIGCAITVAQIATGEEPDVFIEKSGRSKSGKAGSVARNKALTPEERSEIAKLAAEARWKNDT